MDNEYLKQIYGLLESGATLGTGAVSGLVGLPYGLYKGVTSGAYGTPEAPRIAAREAQQFMERNTYQPRSAEGQANLQQLAGLLEASKLPPVMPEASLLAAIPKQAYAAQAERAGIAAEKAIAPVVTRTMERGGLPADLLSDLTQGTRRQIFIGAESPMFDSKMAFKAENMASKNKTAKEIWKETGSIKGVDGQWRQEISDKESKILTGKLPTEYIDEAGYVPSWKISESLDHPELYKAYPDLKNVGGSFNNDVNTNVLATYYPATDSISYNKGKFQRGLLTDTQQQEVDVAKKKWDDFRTSDEWTSYNDMLEKADESGKDIKNLVNPDLEKKAKTLSNKYQDLQYSFAGTGEGGVGLSPSSRTITLHELQHAIQEREGFGIGGSPSMFPSESEMNTAKIIGARIQSGDTPSEAAKWVRENLGHSTNPQVMDWAMRKDVASFPSDKTTLYKNLAGEAEARLTERRMNLTPEERRTYFPYEYDPSGAKYGLDVKPEDLLHFNPAGYFVKKGISLLD